MLSKLNKFERLSERVIRILGCNPGPMTLQGTNTYLVGTGRSRLLIDTGSPNIPAYREHLAECLRTCYSWDTCSIEGIILTHWHQDHVGGILDVLNDLEVGQNPIPLYKYPEFENETSPISNNPANLKYTFISDKQVISTEGATLEVLYTPGHTTDHISLNLIEEDVIFCGDCVLGEGTVVFEDLNNYMKSLQLLLEVNPKLMYPGHGKVIEDPTSLILYYMKHRMQRQKQIIDCLQVGISLTSKEIMNMIYFGLPENLLLAAEQNVISHLKNLCEENRVSLVMDKWILSS